MNRWMSLAVLAGCSADPGGHVFASHGDGTTDAHGDATVTDSGATDGPSAGSTGSEIKYDVGSQDLGGGSCGPSCTSDLKATLGCDGQVQEVCAPEGGCVDGECIQDACDAAQAAQSAIGCDFWAAKSQVIADARGACYAMHIANTWDTPAHIEVMRGGAGLSGAEDYIRRPSGEGSSILYHPYDPAEGIPPGETAVVFLSRGPGPLQPCPFGPAFAGEAGIDGSGIGLAFNVRTDVPVIAYSVLPYGGGPSAATSASLLLPTSAWGDNYVAVEPDEGDNNNHSGAHPATLIIAQEDDTQVRVQSLFGLPAVGAHPQVPAGGVGEYPLDRGEFIQLATDGLTGTAIEADRRVGVIGAHGCIFGLDLTCDTAHQQIPPVRAVGREYAATVPVNGGFWAWQVVGLVPDTLLDWGDEPPSDAPAQLGPGDSVSVGDEFFDLETVHVKSQDSEHPFVLMLKAASDPPEPDWVLVPPVEQFLQSYLFYTDPTYSETNLVVVRVPDNAGAFADVELDCRGTLEGWQDLGDFQSTRVNMVTGDFAGVGGCSNGTHRMSSALPFSVTVWGGGSPEAVWISTIDVSYAYPAGLNLVGINDVNVPAG